MASASWRRNTTVLIGVTFSSLRSAASKVRSVSPSAIAYTNPVVIDKTTPVSARAKSGTNWSALPVEATFNIARYANALRITEMMYHPAQQAVAGDEDNYEFLELKNTGATPVNVSGFFFDGITHTFPPGTVIPSNSFYVLARSRTAFSNRYPGITVNVSLAHLLDLRIDAVDVSGHTDLRSRAVNATA